MEFLGSVHQCFIGGVEEEEPSKVGGLVMLSHLLAGSFISPSHYTQYFRCIDRIQFPFSDLF